MLPTGCPVVLPLINGLLCLTFEQRSQICNVQVVVVFPCRSKIAN